MKRENGIGPLRAISDSMYSRMVVSIAVCEAIGFRPSVRVKIAFTRMTRMNRDHLFGFRGVSHQLSPFIRLPRIVRRDITSMTWSRFFDGYEPIRALVAERADQLLGLAHFLSHRSTIHIGPTCYLQDLFTAEAARGKGVGRALIEAVNL